MSSSLLWSTPLPAHRSYRPGAVGFQIQALVKVPSVHRKCNGGGLGGGVLVLEGSAFPLRKVLLTGCGF